MKTKDLIALLQKEDPSGEIECCVGNVDIHFVQRLPAYYDGPLQTLIRDPNTEYYDIIGGKYHRSGQKIDIHTLSIIDAIFNDEHMIVKTQKNIVVIELNNIVLMLSKLKQMLKNNIFNNMSLKNIICMILFH